MMFVLTTASPRSDAPGPGGPWSAALARVAGLTQDPGAGATSPCRPRPPLPSSFGKQLILKCFTITKITAGTRPGQSATHRMRPHLLLLPPFYRNLALPTLHILVRGCNNVTPGLTPLAAAQGPVLISCKFHSVSLSARTTPGELVCRKMDLVFVEI